MIARSAADTAAEVSSVADGAGRGWPVPPGRRDRWWGKGGRPSVTAPPGTGQELGPEWLARSCRPVGNDIRNAEAVRNGRGGNGERTRSRKRYRVVGTATGYRRRYG